MATDDEGWVLDEYGNQYGHCNSCGEEARAEAECCEDGEVVPDGAPEATPFGHCARCRQELTVSTGADGPVIASVGYCPDCKITTMWEITNAT